MARYLVTGANGGMGREISSMLFKEGNEVFALDVTPPQSEVPWTFIKADVTDTHSLEEAFGIIRSSGKLDGVIHTAGLYDLNSLAEISEEAFVRIFNINLFGVYRINKLAVPLLNKGAHCVIVTSELAPLSPLPFTGIYAITKSALDKYAYSLRMELQLLGCSVSVIRPGAVKTDMLPSSLSALDRFCGETKLYPVNAKRFKNIVSRVEARSVTPQKLAEKVLRILKTKNPKFAYKINRNPLLLMLNALPKRMQFWIIRKILS